MSEVPADTAEAAVPAAPRRRRWGRWGAIGFIPFLGVMALIWLSTSAGPAVEAEYALIPGAGVQVQRTDAGFEFTPEDAEPRQGIVLYPGGRVDPRSYATLAREIVLQEDVLVIITPMRFDLAILSADRAAEALAGHPEVDQWTLVGHSLGGVAACQYIAEHPGDFDALVLLAAYPDEGTDLSGTDIAAVSITASQDTVMDRTAFDSARARLPGSTDYVEIEGGNHAQFGSYGAQPGDSPARIGAVDQRTAVVDAMREVLEGSAE